mgnify:CR=1 FL=1
MRKKIKKAVGGTIESKKFYKGYRLEDGKPVVFSRKGLTSDIQAREIDDAELYKKALIKRHNDTNYENQLMKAVGEAGLKKVLKMLDREIDAKKAGMAATSIYPFENPIPTLQGTVQDKKTKKETDKYLKKKRAKGRNKTRMKKGGIVKSHRGDGIAKRGRTRGRIV